MSPLRLLVASLLLVALALPAGAAADTSLPPSALLVFVPRTIYKTPGKHPKVLDRLDRRQQLSLGLVGATQGRFTPEQALLDITQGTRASLFNYNPQKVPPLTFLAVGSDGVIYHWYDAVQRAETAPADLTPGLLASSIPGGVEYVGIAGIPHLEAVAAADKDGLVEHVSLGPSPTLTDRVTEALKRHRLVVTGLATGARGFAELDGLLARRTSNELIFVMQTPAPSRARQLLPAGMVGPDVRTAALTSDTTRRPGIVTGIDILPTILKHLAISIPTEVKGQPITTTGKRDAAALEDLASRLGVIGARRTPAIQSFFFFWMAITLLLGAWRDQAGRRLALRLGGLAVMWLPTTLLISAWAEPSRTIEIYINVGGSFLLAFLTDRFVPWPRGPAIPAAAGLGLHVIDLFHNSDLLVGSLLGPNPRSGARFFGIGNELEIGLTMLFLVGLAAALPDRKRSVRGAVMFAVFGLGLAAVIGAGRLGADVGGIFTVGGGTVAAVLLMLPKRPSRRTILLACLVPFAGIGLLALLDLATGGNGHFTRTVLHAKSFGDLFDTVARRYELAWSILITGYVPLLTIMSLLGVWYGLKHRVRVYASVIRDPVWVAGLGGGLAASVAGAIFNDSGPVILIIGVVVLACVTAYLRGMPGDADPVGRDESAAAPTSAGRDAAATEASSPEPVAR